MSVDLTKAFDRIEHPALFLAMADQGVHQEYLRIQADIYHPQVAAVNGGEPFDITRGVKQGDVLSSLLFNAGLEQAIRRFKLRIGDRGIDVGGLEKLTNVRYADDIVLYARSASEASTILLILKDELRRCGLALNATKTKVVTSEQGAAQSLSVDSEEIPVMTNADTHKYLGKCFSGDLSQRASFNLNYRLQCAWGKFHLSSNVFMNRAVSLKLRLRMFDAVVSPTATYSLASTALTQQQRNRLAATRSKMLRKMLCYRKASLETWEEYGRKCKRGIDSAVRLYAVSDWVDVVDRSRWRLLAHVAKSCPLDWTRLVLSWVPSDRRRGRGRPRGKWTSTLEKFVFSLGHATITDFIENTMLAHILQRENEYVRFLADL